MLISIDCFFRTGKVYYPQVYLEKCKYVIKDITDYVEISFDSDEEILEKIQVKKNSDEEDSSEEDPSEKNSDGKNYFFSTCINITEKLPDYKRNYHLAYKK